MSEANDIAHPSIIAQIARDLDLNSLDNISRTCRLFRALLHAHRKSLIAIALRCSSSEARRNEKQKEQKDNNTHSLVTKYKRSPCAVDLVGECRRCGVLVCRNCTAKTLPPARLAKRHRRLCKACLRAPLSMLTAPHLDSQTFAYPAFARGACECAVFFWLCQPCGQDFPAHDTSYFRIWLWRISYGHLGGLGTGIGEGNEGVKCGRGERCLAARKTEVEEDCTLEAVSAGTKDGKCTNTTSSPTRYANMDDYDPEKAGYLRQEVEGLGGHIRGKIKRMVVVGQTVEEHEDERENGSYLNREAKGLCRSWCSWCERVIPSEQEVKSDSLLLRGTI